MRRSPDPAVVAWAEAQLATEAYTTSITVAEIGYGIERLPDGGRKETLRSLAQEVFSLFADRVLAFDVHAAAHYPHLVSDRDRDGLPIDGFDAQIAAICRQHRAVLATRNGHDFQRTGIELIDPWHPA